MNVTQITLEVGHQNDGGIGIRLRAIEPRTFLILSLSPFNFNDPILITGSIPDFAKASLPAFGSIILRTKG